jgi:hypothetical protein
VFCDKPINKFPRVLPKYEPQPNKLDEENEPTPQAYETIKLEEIYDPNYDWEMEIFRNRIPFTYDDDEVDDDYEPNIIHIYPGWREDLEYEEEEFDDDEFEEFVEPEFNPELEIHNELKPEINELDNEPISQINDDA